MDEATRAEMYQLIGQLADICKAQDVCNGCPFQTFCRTVEGQIPIEIMIAKSISDEYRELIRSHRVCQNKIES